MTSKRIRFFVERMSKSLKYMHQKRFGGLRDMVLERDRYCCVSCGMTREAHKRLFGCDLTINHIDGKGRHCDEPNNTMENLETLCLRCHGAKDAWKTGKYSIYAIEKKIFPTRGLNDTGRVAPAN